MSFTTITMTNGVETKKVPLGYSWTTCIFSGFPALLRKDYGRGVAFCFFSAIFLFTGFLCAFLYNKEYANDLLKQGFKVNGVPFGITDEQIMKYLGIKTLPRITS
jgi:hypothetical protein